MRQMIFGFSILVFGIAAAEDLRMNQIQVIGTHNSYHLAPPEGILKTIALGSPATAESIDYSHRPLPVQLEKLRVRQVELDIYADPQGGLYSDPIGFRSLRAAGSSADKDPNAGGALDAPGMKIIHSPGFDYLSTVPTLVAALRQIRTWSQSHPQHVPILILVELKESVIGPADVTPVLFDKVQLDAIDQEILSVFAAEEMILPDQIRGQRSTLREAILTDGWPSLEDGRGKVWFAMDNGGELRNRYLLEHPTLENRVMFVSVDAEHPAAAFMKLNDPIGSFQQIQQVVHRGFVVRTRADADTRQARSGDTSRRDAALASGAQYISTDYPQPDKRFSAYQVSLQADAEFRRNPVSANPTE